MVEKVSQLGEGRAERRCQSRRAAFWCIADSADQDDDEAPGPLQKIRASICEIAELYAQKYSDAFTQLGAFVDGVWNMLTILGPGAKEDVVSVWMACCPDAEIYSSSPEH